MIFNETMKTKHRQTQSCFREDLWEEDSKVGPGHNQENQRLNKRSKIRKFKVQKNYYLPLNM